MIDETTQMQWEILALTDVRAIALRALRQIAELDAPECTLVMARQIAERSLSLIEELEAR